MSLIPEQFYRIEPTQMNYWRSIILFGKNTATYKFSLAKVLLLHSNNNEWIRIEDLARSYSQNICAHIKDFPRQNTATQSKFIQACDNFIKGIIDESILIDHTIKYGFNHVLDAFHIVGNKPLINTFFIDERKFNKGIRLTDNLFKLTSKEKIIDLINETEARWRLVEYAWSQNMNKSIIEYDSHSHLLYNSARSNRINLASCRDALNGYQKGKCFYCFDKISIDTSDHLLADIDHFFPFKMQNNLNFCNINGIWNLVLACKECNRGHLGKFDRLAHLSYLKRLNRRNEYLIASHHPLKETLIKQTGSTPQLRKIFLQKCFDNSKLILIHEWITPTKGEHAF